MREIKDTLGIKYNKYTDIYKADNEQLGLLLKYIMWEFGKDVILSDVSELTRKRIEKKSKEIEEQIEELLEDDEFERVFNSLTQQIKRSHHSWKLLKENLEKNKKKDNTTPTVTTTPAETPKAKSEPPKAKSETTETATETEKSETEKAETTEAENEEAVKINKLYDTDMPGCDDYYFITDNRINLSTYAKKRLEEQNITIENILYFLYKHRAKFNRITFNRDIDEVIDEYKIEKKEFELPFSVDD